MVELGTRFASYLSVKPAAIVLMAAIDCAVVDCAASLVQRWLKSRDPVPKDKCVENASWQKAALGMSDTYRFWQTLCYVLRVERTQCETRISNVTCIIQT